MNPFDLPAGEFMLSITDENGCVKDTVIVLTQPDDLELTTGLSPNGDGMNDFYVIFGVAEHPDNTFKVFNRWGNLVYEISGYLDQWYGQNMSGENLSDGTYFIVFEADDRTFNSYVDLRRQ
jgi:gliding motility-associated-like protein